MTTSVLRVSVDADVCAGHGACVATCPDVFVINDDGYAAVVVDTVPDSAVDLVRKAAHECPTQAITLAAEPA